MSSADTIVLKFGGSVLRSEDDLPAAVHEIYRWVRAGHPVVAVVSALGGTTDALLDRARAFGDHPDPSATAALLSTGESIAASLLALACDRAGVPASVLDPARIGLAVTGDPLNATPLGVNVEAIETALESAPVAIVPGFIGRLEDGRIALLGRGGSDLTALFLARRLGARCRLVKDVDGLYESDPALGGSPRRYDTLSWDDALALGDGVIQAKALVFAREQGLAFEVAGLDSDRPTRVGKYPASFHVRAEQGRPLRVALLGCGTVGLGVYRRLADRPDRWNVVRVLVRRPELEREDGPPADILTTDPGAVLAGEVDVVVDALANAALSGALVRAALERGLHVVTACKEIVAGERDDLERLAVKTGGTIRFGATVGGAVPVIETVERLAATSALLAIEGVVNGTTNFILDRLAAGDTLAGAVSEAQRLGFAEADPRADLDGRDAARKLAILARTGFGESIEVSSIERTGIEGLEPAWVRAQARRGRVVRLVAGVRRNNGAIVAEVRPVALRRDHPLAGTRDEQNRVFVQPLSGAPSVVHGRGAGRWPTTEAVLADLADVARAAHGASRMAVAL